MPEEGQGGDTRSRNLNLGLVAREDPGLPFRAHDDHGNTLAQAQSFPLFRGGHASTETGGPLEAHHHRLHLIPDVRSVTTHGSHKALTAQLRKRIAQGVLADTVLMRETHLGQEFLPRSKISAFDPPT